MKTGAALDGAVLKQPLSPPAAHALMHLTVFVWGPKRALPVKLTEFSITEEAHDVRLNPIRAKLSLSLRVLSVDDLGFDNKGGGLFMSYLQRKEQLAARGAGGSLGQLGLTGVP